MVMDNDYDFLSDIDLIYLKNGSKRLMSFPKIQLSSALLLINLLLFLILNCKDTQIFF